MIANWCSSRTTSRGCITSAQAQKKSFPQLVRKHAHPLCTLPTSNTWIFIFQKWRWGRRVVAVVQGWRSLVTLHVPVCVRLHLRLSSHLTALSVSTADQNTSLSLTGWTDSAAIQTDSSSGSWWREGGRQESGGERLDKRGVKEHTNNKRSKLKSVNTLKSSTQHDPSYCCFPEFKKTPTSDNKVILLCNWAIVAKHYL